MSAGAIRPRTASTTPGGPTPTPPRILVVKLGALGDIVQALGPFAAIRRHHAASHITLLTTMLFADFLRGSPYFDEVLIDRRRPLWDVASVLNLRRRLRAACFDRVYDLQTSGRSSLYFHLLGPGRRPEWSGIARGCSHPHGNPQRDTMHTIERQAEQLAAAGIAATPPPDLSWVRVDPGRFGVSAPYVLLIPGGSVHRPEKRWPAENYAELARRLHARDYGIVLLGTAMESEVMTKIRMAAAGVQDLAGETSFTDIVGLARGAAGALGNDTGPMHLIAAAGCPSTVLFSNASDPALCAPRAPRAPAGVSPITILRRPSLADLSVDDVEASLQLRDR